MKFGTIVFLLFACVSIQSVSGHIGQCRRQNKMLHDQITWLNIVNKRLVCKLKEKKDCSHNGKTNVDGETFEDECNVCVCNNGIVACTKNPCYKGCRYSGMDYLHGAEFTPGDGCYSCTCKHGCVDCSTRICASPGQLGTYGPTSRTSPTQNNVPGGPVHPNAPEAPWKAVDGDPKTCAIVAYQPAGIRGWWMLEFQCLETISAVNLTSSTSGDASLDFRSLTISVDGVVCGTVGASPGAGVTVTVTCGEPLTGKSLKIVKDEDAEPQTRLAEVVPILEALPGGDVCEFVPLQ